jgi:excisionase family DNA binding protein
MHEGKLLWNVKEAGTALGHSHWTIRRWIGNGKLSPARLGRRVLIEPSECRRLVEQCRGPLPERVG